MEKYRNYVKILTFSLITLLLLAMFYLYFYSIHYPLPHVHRISIDAKIKFIKEKTNIETVDTLIIGSSIGLNNIQGSQLENSCNTCNNVLNLSAFELRPKQVTQLLELSTLFPNLKRIIYSAQFSDFSEDASLKNFDSNKLKKYITSTMTFKDQILLLVQSDIGTCIKRHWEWEKKYQPKNKFSSLNFDHTGSVPLEIYEKKAIQHRWEKPHTAKVKESNYAVLKNMVKSAQKMNIDFLFVVQPYRNQLLRKNEDVNETLQTFIKTTKEITHENGGQFLSLHHKLYLDDSDFADRSHLNAKGSILSTKAIGKFLEK